MHTKTKAIRASGTRINGNATRNAGRKVRRPLVIRPEAKPLPDWMENMGEGEFAALARRRSR